MSDEVAVTLLVPFGVIAIGLLVSGIRTKMKRWRKKRLMERGISDFVRQVRS